VLPREYYEAWYFGHPGRRRVLLAGQNGDQHRYRVRVGQRRAIAFFGTSMSGAAEFGAPVSA